MQTRKPKAKAEAFRLFGTGMTAKAIAEKIGITEKTAGNWKRQYLKNPDLTDQRKTHLKAVRMLNNGKSIAEVSEALNTAKTTVRRWKKGDRKLKRSNLIQRFLTDFPSGKHSVAELARRYGVSRGAVQEWKYRYFGTGSIRQKRIWEMHLVGIPGREIAKFYGVHIFQIHRSIRETKKIIAENPQQSLFLRD